MRIRFWGARGSLPSPLLPSQVRDKLSEALAIARPEDLLDSESRKRFIDGLPPWLSSTVGGNTSCVSIDIDGLGGRIVFDCGSGMRELGKADAAEPASKYHVFLSHFHWDHLQGLPFFGPAFRPSVSVDFYSPRPGFETDLAGLMRDPYSPIRIEDMPSKKRFRLLEAPIDVGGAKVSFKPMCHPNGSFAYRLVHNGRRFIYATDSELDVDDFADTVENRDFFTGADLIMVDAQYTLLEAIQKRTWGHSSYSMAVEFAARWGIGHLVLFHHDPASDDRKLHGILRSARAYARRLSSKGIEVTLAQEGGEIIL